MALESMPGSSENLTRIFNELRSKDEKCRQKAADDLRETASAGMRKLPEETKAHLTNEINKRIFDLAQSSDNNDKLGAIAAIRRLIDLAPEDNADRYKNYLLQILPYNDPRIMMPAAETIGELAVSSPIRAAEMVKELGEKATEWLDIERSRLAAFLVLRQLAIKAPTLIYAHAQGILDKILNALSDVRQTVREKAVECLGQFLKIVQQRDNQVRDRWCSQIWERVQRGLQTNNAESIHASLLLIHELLLHAGMFITSMYKDVCEINLKLKDSNDALIRRTVVTNISTLASYDPDTFAELYLQRFMAHLLSLLHREKDKREAFIAIGDVALQVKSSISPYLERIVAFVKEALMLKERQRKEVEFATFLCISRLVTAVGQAMTKHINNMLDLMFNCGLSQPLVSTLSVITVRIRPLSSIIEDRLLNVISIILSGQPYCQPGSPVNRSQHPVERLPREANSTDVRDNSERIIILALETLGSFEFSNYVLNEFVRECVVNYLEDDVPEIRKYAAVTCCQLFVRDPICKQTSTYAIKVVGEVLEKLLTVGIADPDPHIRQTVLSSLDPCFDRHLAQADNVRSLLIALNDEVFSIRETSMAILGRLAAYNPAYIMPPLRMTLIPLITALEYSSVSRQREEAARLIALLVGTAQRLTKHYIRPILKVLLKRARDQPSNVVSAVLDAIGVLATVSGKDMMPHLHEIVPLITETLQAQNTRVQRDAALKTLGLLASNTGFVIEPYARYPGLLNILISILKTEQHVPSRRKTLKVIGILGALDPNQYKIYAAGQLSEDVSDSKHTSTDAALLISELSARSEDEYMGYYSKVVLELLLSLLKDPTLSQHHSAVIEAIGSMYTAHGLTLAQFIPDVIPGFISLMRSSTPRLLGSYFHKLAELVLMVKQHIRNNADDLCDLINEKWQTDPQTRLTIISLIEAIAKVLEGELKVYLPSLLPRMLELFDTEARDPPDQRTTTNVFRVFVIIGSSIEDYIHLVVPAVVKFIEKPDAPEYVRTREAMITIAALCKKVNLSDYASRIILPITRELPKLPPDMRNVSMDLLCALVFRLGADFAKFVPVINKVLTANRIVHTNYQILVGKLLKNESLPHELGGVLENRDLNGNEVSSGDMSSRKPRKELVNQSLLKSAWQTSQRSTKDDWKEWERKLNLEFLRNSVSPALRSCYRLAMSYPPLGRDLFNIAFHSCWDELYDEYKADLVKSLEAAFEAPKIPPEIVQILLHLAEFMEHDRKDLTIPKDKLSEYAQKCHAYAKALHYRELEWNDENADRRPHSVDAIEKLLTINNALQLPDAAMGVLTYAQDILKLESKVSWYEKLHRYQDALKEYEKQQYEDPSSMSITLGRMRCLHALGEWDQLASLAQEKWIHATTENREKVAPLAAAAAWGLGHWEQLEEYIALMKSDDPDHTFYRAILAMHRNRYEEAERFINDTRDLRDTELTTLLGESYNRAYDTVVHIQMLAELDEMIVYRQSTDDPEKQNAIRRTWIKRLEGCDRNVEVWQRILRARTMVVTPLEDMDLWIKFANLCRKNGRISLSAKTLQDLIDASGSSGPHPKIMYAQLKHMWDSASQSSTPKEAEEVRLHALAKLREFTAEKTQELGLNPDELAISTPIDASRLAEDVSDCTRLLSRCYLRQGEWERGLSYDLADESIPSMLGSFLLATRFDQNWYKAWHGWALANFDVVDHMSKQNPDLPQNTIVRYVVPAMRGFFRSIALSKESTLQDTLRLLTLWFKYGHIAEVNNTIAEGFTNVSIDVWLQVIPQIIARIHASNDTFRRIIQQLLTDIGKEHPQALLYSLMVASKSHSVIRQRATSTIIDKMRTHSPVLVKEALMVSDQLIRVAILWQEKLPEIIDLVYRHYVDRKYDAMLSALDSAQQMMQTTNRSVHEERFLETYGANLQAAYEHCQRFRETGDINLLNEAWTIYRQTYDSIRRANTSTHPMITQLELAEVSPQLYHAQDLELGIPGYYRSGEPIVRISKFEKSLEVLQSKQRPRKLTIKGSDGKKYMYLLKGHEDLRQDERVVQFFGLVNSLLKNDTETFKRHLNIERFPVIPLSPDSGLIGWVPETDTFHALIKSYRDSRGVLVNYEHRIMCQMSPDYDASTVMQKVEVLRYALDKASSREVQANLDLYNILWLKSQNSEVWLDQRTNYTRSLAVMSMVGYILGLGDRHPSNLMLHRKTGKVIHIDFGDCFEVAMHRDMFPEKWPFRLTRMLVEAMEVSGIEGSFRIACEHVMRVLRDNRESLMAVLEAFVHDPLLSWRLLNPPTVPDQTPNDRVGIDSFQSEDISDDPHSYSLSRRINRIEVDAVENATRPEDLNTQAVAVVNRVSDKLTGRDFNPRVTLDVHTQVDKLIQQAQALENLCQAYVGWCPFW